MGITLGWTKPVTSISGTPASAIISIIASFSSVVGTCHPSSCTIVWSPSRMSTSTIRALG
ncbi:unannotated protein [freshwater metagenome]|uniref:Unannotated protein n=1 Tax=freshwater metagenome TaxID=449393 RepID=A0A6J7PGU6_9ZZZZ